MASTSFTNNITVIDATWLNDVNAVIYGPTSPAGTLRAQLIASSGSTLVSFTASGAGALTRTLQVREGFFTWLKDYATGDGVTNDGTGARNALTSFSTSGGELRIGLGTYILDAVSGASLAITKPISIVGDGGVYTALNPSLGLSTDNNITITPSPSFDHSGMRVSGFALHDPATGTRVGNNGILADTQVAGANLGRFCLRDMQIGQGNGATGFGFFHINNPANNVNGGLFTALFQNNSIKGGIKLDSSGDSISIVHNTLTGSRLGVSASLVAGASLLEVQANNITANWGAFRLDAGPRYRFIGNNCEHSTTGSVTNNNSSLVNITGSNGTIYGGVVKENLLSVFGATDAATLLRIRNSRGTLIEDNTFLSGGGGTAGIDIGSDCTDIRVGANTYNAAVTTKVVDAGVGTMGVIKTPTMVNGWVAFGVGTATLQMIKDINGIVHVWGSVKNGTTTLGILVTTLAVGYRPSETQRVPAFADNTGTRTIAQVTVEADGSLRFNYAQPTEMAFNFSFPAANLADSVSAE